MATRTTKAAPIAVITLAFDSFTKNKVKYKDESGENTQYVSKAAFPQTEGEPIVPQAIVVTITAA